MAEPVVANILYGNAVVWVNEVGGALPDEDSVGYGTAWGGTWERVGLTKAPLVMAYEDEQGEAVVQEALTAVKRWRTAEAARLETVLAEIMSDNLKLAIGGGTATTEAAASSEVGKDEFIIGGESLMDENLWGFEGRYVDSSGNKFPVRLFVWKATAKLNGTLEFSKEDYPGIPIQINALADVSRAIGDQLFKFQRVTVAAT